MFEFHVSRQARQTYQFDEELFATDGRAVVANFDVAKRFAGKLSAGRAAPVPASDINAMGLLDEVMHILIRQYELENPGVMKNALDNVSLKVGAEQADQTLLIFTQEFPPMPVFKNQKNAQVYLNEITSLVPHRQILLEEMLLLHLTNLNPATQPYAELFDETPLMEASAYQAVVSGVAGYLNGALGWGGASQKKESLLDVLRAPVLASPHSLSGQIEYVIHRWGNLLGEHFINQLKRGIDFLKEETIRHTGTGGFGGDAPVLQFEGSPVEYEKFSPDKEWMPRLVLIAKNAYVWLGQLSQEYGRDINQLDQVPDEALNQLADRGFTGLWLIGLWERSKASQFIKQRMGQHDAVASAYSLYSYDIAADLGGWEAINRLRERAWQRGIRLAADMVPNHMGIDSKWVVEHPDWFLSVSQPPYPNYKFESEDLSTDGRVGIFLEDHYYNHTDAAVTFKRLDRQTGEERFLYHGNDGTSMPWNDTAQLDYLNPTVREAVIQTILHVARNFPVIRFDAAMTLAKKHIQRLWFPAPGAGGAIPSRAQFGLTQSDFEAKIPQEFWREVVDRVAAEVPDTLLLAEAFWMMEGYFVRTLGMHRVYNSAFMHMLRDEENNKYQALMRNTLEFDPRILQRFVNFMNNPDEKTAVEQFGKADKYFGICVLMSTLPGLPMFGHGQIEGFAEKYGMEFRAAKWKEEPDQGFINYHQKIIFPLLHRRAIFAGVENFRLYSFINSAGQVNENVFAYSNRVGDERSLVLVHNQFAETQGWVKLSAGFADGGGISQQSLAESFGLPNHPLDFVIFTDVITGQEYIRSCPELHQKGLYTALKAYQFHVFLNWRLVYGTDWQQVHDELNGAGSASIQDIYHHKFNQPQPVEPVKKKVRKPVAKKDELIKKKKPTKTEKPKAK